ncbi:MAG TPA: hypothetical protein VIL28_02795 [Steroidobacteraceae bacterium]
MPKQQLPLELEAATPGVPNELVEQAPESELFDDPADYSAVGGPETEPAYGRTRSVAGEYPFNAYGGSYDRDEPPSQIERGGIMTRHRVERLT